MTRFARLTASLSALTFVSVWTLAGGVPKPGTAAADPAAAEASVYYPGCNAARAAGAAPIYRGQPGYREEMDGDGIACEAHRL